METVMFGMHQTNAAQKSAVHGYASGDINDYIPTAHVFPKRRGQMMNRSREFEITLLRRIMSS
jgi:hypothetical protein